jgi:hypothetical protein
MTTKFSVAIAGIFEGDTYEKIDTKPKDMDEAAFLS